MTVRTCAAAFAAVLCCAAPAALAAGASDRNPANEGQAVQAGSGELSAVTGKKITMSEAIPLAEKRGGGHAIAARLAKQNGHPVYDVKVYRAGQVWEGEVDADNGLVMGAGKTAPVDQAEPDAKPTLQALTRVKTTLAQAVGKVEQQTHGTPVEARLQLGQNGAPTYQVTVNVNGRSEQVGVDPMIAQATVTQARPKPLQ
jgi:uncharacterized membrane protein YkoI